MRSSWLCQSSCGFGSTEGHSTCRSRYSKYGWKAWRSSPRTFSRKTADGRNSRIARMTSGNRLRPSFSARCFPPRLNGWHGAPAASNRTFPLSPSHSALRTSPSRTFPDSVGWCDFVLCRSVSQEKWSSSYRSAGANPDVLRPTARPPAPAKRSTSIDIIRWSARRRF